ncbi:hypothetical protein AC579_4406 [Pseudocercospora musae]|uniref:Uncharacterized protein n=1 Tax=Pseudocercospora musae TaxID=113226 RepID=A0A139I727_9PEZI|nr:hypothetical protein AC579_4406 [Pseudocercospora musae]
MRVLRVNAFTKLVGSSSIDVPKRKSSLKPITRSVKDLRTTATAANELNLDTDLVDPRKVTSFDIRDISRIGKRQEI